MSENHVTTSTFVNHLFRIGNTSPPPPYQYASVQGLMSSHPYNKKNGHAFPFSLNMSTICAYRYYRDLHLKYRIGGMRNVYEI